MRNPKAQSLIEYAMLIIIILGAMTVMQVFVSRHFNGHWKGAGETLAWGRQYQSGKTAECAYAQIDSTYGVWFNTDCYQQALTKKCKAGDTQCENEAREDCGAQYCCEGVSGQPGTTNCATAPDLPIIDCGCGNPQHKYPAPHTEYAHQSNSQVAEYYWCDCDAPPAATGQNCNFNGCNFTIKGKFYNYCQKNSCVCDVQNATPDPDSGTCPAP